MDAATGGGAARAAPARGKLHPEAIVAGNRYRRRDGEVTAVVLAVASGHVLIRARWTGSRGEPLFNILRLPLSDFGSRYNQRGAR